MRESIKVNLQDPGVRAIVHAAFPSYRGRKVRIVVADGPQTFQTWWDGGSRDEVTAVDLASMRTRAMPDWGPFTAPEKAREVFNRGVPMLPNVAIVSHSIFCGKDAGIRIYIHPGNAAKFLPGNVRALGCLSGMFAPDAPAVDGCGDCGGPRNVDPAGRPVNGFAHVVGACMSDIRPME